MADLQHVCSPSQFSSLRLFLTLDRLDEHPDYSNWSVSEGRWKTYNLIISLLGDIIPQEPPTILDSAKALETLLSVSLSNDLHEDSLDSYILNLSKKFQPIVINQDLKPRKKLPSQQENKLEINVHAETLNKQLNNQFNMNIPSQTPSSKKQPAVSWTVESIQER